MSSQARWSGAVSPSMPYRCRDRRAAHVCIQGARGQKIGAGPCCSGNDCTGQICPKAWYTLTHIQCAASGTGHPHCRLWPRPDTGSPSKGPDQSLQGVREGAECSNKCCVVIRGEIKLLLTFAPDIIFCWHKTRSLSFKVSQHSWERKKNRERTGEVFHISVENWKEVKVSKTQREMKIIIKNQSSTLVSACLALALHALSECVSRWILGRKKGRQSLSTSFNGRGFVGVCRAVEKHRHDK